MKYQFGKPTAPSGAKELKMKNETPEFITTFLESRIAAKQEKLKHLLEESGLFLYEAIELSLECPDMPVEMTRENVKAWSEYYNANAQAIAIASLDEEIAMNMTSLDLTLMHCPKKYVVVSGNLQSPSGFNASDRVFVQTDVAIHTDTKPKSSSCSTDLYVVDLETLDAAYL